MQKPSKTSPWFYDSDWDYYDALEAAYEEHWNSKPLSQELEEDMNIEVSQIDAEK